MRIEDFNIEQKENRLVDDHGVDDEEEDEKVRVRVRVLVNEENVVVWDAKKALIGAGGRVLFYPTLLYNVVRNKLEVEFRWWDRIDQFILLGAVPFPGDVLRLKELGVRGVVTLNEPFETLVPTSLYHAHGIDHLVLPTRDYYFAPSINDICQAVQFIHSNASQGWMTYVHCKAGRGRSTTIVLCYLVKYKHMTPEDAYSFVRSIRPRVLLAGPQWQAVKDYYNFNVKSAGICTRNELMVRSSGPPSMGNSIEFDDRSVVVVTTTDLDGYDPSDPSVEGNQILADPSVIYKVREAGQAAMARLSCLWLRCHAQQKIVEEALLRKSGCTITAHQRTSNVNVDIDVY
ncbi:hypothetical protein vseg_020349 [Gypsophila vaccaria]